MKRLLFVCITLAIFFAGSSANAVSLATLMSGDLSANGGYWYAMNKGYLYSYAGGYEADPVGIKSFDFLAGVVSGANQPAKLSLTYMTSGGPLDDLKITNAELKIFGAYHELLLSAVSTSGSISIVPELGSPGQFDFLSAFNVNGGSLFDSGALAGSIYATFNYNTGFIADSQDFHFTDGKFSISYGGGSAEVPEPASAVLLISSLAGFVARRKKQRNL